MNIVDVSNVTYVGLVTKHHTHSQRLTFTPNPSIKNMLTLDTGRVYLITVDGVIQKIGGSQSVGGIKSTISLYLNGFAKGNSMRTYCCWNFMHQQVSALKKVQFWCLFVPIVTAEITTLNDKRSIEIPVDFHLLEKLCIDEYFAREGSYPFLNMQESGRKWRDTDLLEGYLG